MEHKKIICLVVGDEPPAQQLIQKYIMSVPSLELAAVCANAVDALAALQNSQVGLLFLDIQMPHILNTDFMRTLTNPPKVIFTTAFRKYALEGFELDAVDYLLRPTSFERFLKAVNKVTRLQHAPADQFSIDSSLKDEHCEAFIYLRSDRRMIKINVDDIVYIESNKDYIKVVTKEKIIISKQPISSIEQMISPHLFVRIPRSFIVAINKIEFFTNQTIGIWKHELPISRKYRLDVEKHLNV